MEPRRYQRLRRQIALGCLLCTSFAAHAHADPNMLPTPPDLSPYGATQVLRYAQPRQPNYLRATLEEVGLLSIGFAQYESNQSFNSHDFDFGYDWNGLRDKLSGRGYSLDTNGFNTNFISHPVVGTLYYLAARSNRLPVLESFAYSAVASTLWEYFGELREKASVNDMLVTPIAGLVLGETLLQLGAFFDRSCESVPNRVAGGVFGPIKTLHDALDGVQPLRDVSCDRYGLSQSGAHELRLSLGAGDLLTTGGPSVSSRIESRLGLHTRVVALGTYGIAGEGFDTFADGNLTELWLSGAWAGSGWTDGTLRAALIPFGLHYRSLVASEGGLRGDEVLLGVLFGTEYSLHRFGQDASEQNDRFFALDAPGVSLLYRRFTGAIRLELELQASVALAGIEPFALPSYLLHDSRDGLTSVARLQGYNFAAGPRISPRARLIWSCLEVGAELAATRLWVITALDRYPEQRSHISARELRAGASAWLSAGPRSWPLRFTVSGALLERAGVIATTHASREELRLMGSVDAVL